MEIKEGYLCIAKTKCSLVFFGLPTEKGENYCNLRMNLLAFFVDLKTAKKAQKEILAKGVFINVFIGYMRLEIANPEEINYLKNSASLVVLANSFLGIDLVGKWIRSGASWSLQAGNSLRENGMQPFADFEKAVECMMQTCRQQDGEELSRLATYAFQKIDI